MDLNNIYEDFKNSKITSEEANTLLFPDSKLELNLEQIMQMLEFINTKELKRICKNAGIIKVYFALVLKGKIGSSECLEYILEILCRNCKKRDLNLDITDLILSMIENGDIKNTKFLLESYNDFYNRNRLLHTLLRKKEIGYLEILLSKKRIRDLETLSCTRNPLRQVQVRTQDNNVNDASFTVGLLIVLLFIQFLCFFLLTRLQK